MVIMVIEILIVDKLFWGVIIMFIYYWNIYFSGEFLVFFIIIVFIEWVYCFDNGYFGIFFFYCIENYGEMFFKDIGN